MLDLLLAHNLDVVLNLNFSEVYQNLMHDKQTGAELKGSFTVEIGDQDEASKFRVADYKT